MNLPDASPSFIRLQRGLYTEDTEQLLDDIHPAYPQTGHLLHASQELRATDIYLRLKPERYTTRSVGLAALTTRLNSAGLRVWAVDGSLDYIDKPPILDDFIAGLTHLGDFNAHASPSARFHGFQAAFGLLENLDGFHPSIPESRQTEDQYTERMIVLHKYINALTRVSNLIRSFGMEFSAAVPWWLHEYAGEPMTMLWADGRKGPMEIVMPIVDEYVVMTGVANGGEVVARTMEQARYSEEMARAGGEKVRVLGSVDLMRESEDGRGCKASLLSVAGRLERIESALRICPAFCGTVLRGWNQMIPGEPAGV